MGPTPAGKAGAGGPLAWLPFGLPGLAGPLSSTTRGLDEDRQEVLPPDLESHQLECLSHHHPDPVDIGPVPIGARRPRQTARDGSNRSLRASVGHQDLPGGNSSRTPPPPEPPQDASVRSPGSCPRPRPSGAPPLRSAPAPIPARIPRRRRPPHTTPGSAGCARCCPPAWLSPIRAE